MMTIFTYLRTALLLNALLGLLLVAACSTDDGGTSGEELPDIEINSVSLRSGFFGDTVTVSITNEEGLNIVNATLGDQPLSGITMMDDNTFSFPVPYLEGGTYDLIVNVRLRDYVFEDAFTYLPVEVTDYTRNAKVYSRIVPRDNGGFRIDNYSEDTLYVFADNLPQLSTDGFYDMAIPFEESGRAGVGIEYLFTAPDRIGFSIGFPSTASGSETRSEPLTFFVSDRQNFTFDEQFFLGEIIYRSAFSLFKQMYVPGTVIGALHANLTAGDMTLGDRTLPYNGTFLRTDTERFSRSSQYRIPGDLPAGSYEIKMRHASGDTMINDTGSIVEIVDITYCFERSQAGQSDTLAINITNPEAFNDPGFCQACPYEDNVFLVDLVNGLEFAATLVSFEGTGTDRVLKIIPGQDTPPNSSYRLKVLVGEDYEYQPDPDCTSTSIFITL